MEIVRVTREQIRPLAGEMAGRLDKLADQLTAGTQDRVRYAVSAVRLVGTVDAGSDDAANVLGLVGFNLQDCIDLAMYVYQQTGLEIWFSQYERLKWARDFVRDLRDLPSLVKIAEAAESRVPDGTPDDQMPATVRNSWKQAFQCFVRITNYIQAD